MSLPVALLTLFTIGILHDVLWTVYIRAVSDSRRFKAAFTAGTLTAFGCTAWMIVTKTGAEGSVLGIAAYSIGGAIGTYMCLKSKPKPTE